MAGTTPTSGKNPALQKSLSRRVSFNEATLAKSQPGGNAAANAAKTHHQHVPRRPPSDFHDDSSTSSDMEAQTSRGPRPKCSSRFNSCCAWASLAIGILLLFLLLIGGVYFAFLQSNLPEIRLQRLDITLLNFTNTKTDTFLTTDFEVRLNATNKNSKIELSYGTMTASMGSEGIDLGTAKLNPFQQKPETSMELRVRTRLTKQSVEEAAAKDLSDNSKVQKMVIDVEVKGHIDFKVNGHKLNGFPFRVLCHNIDQAEIDNGQAPKCNVKMSPIY